jgi:hypothetical protein
MEWIPSRSGSSSFLFRVEAPFWLVTPGEKIEQAKTDTKVRKPDNRKTYGFLVRVFAGRDDCHATPGMVGFRSDEP